MTTNPYLLLADGTKLDNCECGFAYDQLWLFLKGMELSDVFRIFIDPEKTKTIQFHFLDVDQTYEGYTVIDTVRNNGPEIDVRLIKPKE